jgi:hypothetical protein
MELGKGHPSHGLRRSPKTLVPRYFFLAQVGLWPSKTAGLLSLQSLASPPQAQVTQAASHSPLHPLAPPHRRANLALAAGDALARRSRAGRRRRGGVGQHWRAARQQQGRRRLAAPVRTSRAVGGAAQHRQAAGCQGRRRCPELEPPSVAHWLPKSISKSVTHFCLEIGISIPQST